MMNNWGQLEESNVDPVAAGILDIPGTFSSGASIIVVQEDKVEAFKDAIQTTGFTKKKKHQDVLQKESMTEQKT